jgi:hypothetical protein
MQDAAFQGHISKPFTLRAFEEMATAMLQRQDEQRQRLRHMGIPVLLKDGDSGGLAAHLPDVQGRPLCRLAVTLTNWRIHIRVPTSLLICHHCLLVRAKQQPAVNPDHPTPPAQSRSVGE